jgi:hypothetical protein
MFLIVNMKEIGKMKLPGIEPNYLPFKCHDTLICTINVLTKC